MKIPKMVEAMGEIDADLVSASARERRKAKQPWVKWSILTAVCLCVAVLAGMIVVPMMLGGDDVLPGKDRETVSFGDLERHYKGMDTVRTESGMMSWPAEYQTVMEKHSHIVWSFRNYVTSGMAVQVQNLGEKIGNYLGFEVREIKGAPQTHVIALGIEGVYYAYRCQVGYDDMPATLGELFDQYNLAEALELDRFTEYEKKYTDKGYYALTDDAYIIDVLASCRDAALYEPEQGKEWERSEEYLSFTMTSDALGVYKKAMYITKDGYLWTNVFEYAYIYEIGTEAANRIIDYAMNNSVEKPMEPYEYKLAGTLVKVENGYAYIDDSIMCVDPSEGMVFRVSTDDIRISRCLVEDLTGITIGDLVVVTFRGGVDVEDSNLILDARGIDQAFLTSEGDAVVPE